MRAAADPRDHPAWSASAASSWRVVSGSATFDADARLGSFAGTTTEVRGEATGDTPATARGWMEVGLDSLRTGNGRRDRHMRDALETSRFPTARFALDSVRATATTPTQVQLFGSFTVHGITRPVRAEGTLDPVSEGGWQLTARFPVSLAAHGITKGISRLGGMMKVEDRIGVRVAATFR